MHRPNRTNLFLVKYHRSISDKEIFKIHTKLEPLFHGAQTYIVDPSDIGANPWHVLIQR